MVVVQRNEVSRSRFLSFLAIVLAAVVLFGIALTFPGRSQAVQLVLVTLALIALVAIILAVIQLYVHPRRSQVLLFNRGEGMIVATNAFDEGVKLRFLLGILGGKGASFSDEERARLRKLE